MSCDNDVNGIVNGIKYVQRPRISKFMVDVQVCNIVLLNENNSYNIICITKFPTTTWTR